MTHAALVIQNGYRSYKRHKKSQQPSLDAQQQQLQQQQGLQSAAAASASGPAGAEQQSSQCLQDYYTTFQARHESSGSSATPIAATIATSLSKEPSPSGPLK